MSKLNVKQVTRMFILVFFLLLLKSPAKACTGFAVYSADTLYAMNLDYPQTDLRFSINMVDDHTFFHAAIWLNGNWASLLGMNDAGLMMNVQECYPRINAVVQTGEQEIDLGQLMWISMGNFENVETTNEFLSATNSRIVQIPNISLHSLHADRDGGACVLEVGPDSNMITSIQDDFLVMTNFNNHQFWDVPYTEVSGIGASRYRTAYANIMENFDAFDFEDALETLQFSVMSSGSYQTICSFVFDPIELYIYIILNRNFEQIYRVSITDNRIETFRGFSYYDSAPLGIQGIQVSELSTILSINNDRNRLTESVVLHQNYPNPFNPSTTIPFQIISTQKVTIEIYNLMGEKINTLIDREIQAGHYTIEWNGMNFHREKVSSGCYIYRITTSNNQISKKMILLN